MIASFFTRHCAVTPARISLACAFPPAFGLRGACTTLADISAHGIIRPLFTPTKADAVRLVIERNMEAVQSDGKGSEARRRAAAAHADARPKSSHIVALPAFSTPEPQGSNRASARTATM